MVNPYKIKNAGKGNNGKIIRQLRCILQHDHYVLKYLLANFLKNIMLSRSHQLNIWHYSTFQFSLKKKKQTTKLAKNKSSKIKLVNRILCIRTWTIYISHLGDFDCWRSSGKTWNTSLEFTDFTERPNATAINCSNSEPVHCAWKKILFLK